MAKFPANKAAYLTAPEGQYVVKDSSYWRPGPGEVVIKNAAVAVNPMDWKIQMLGANLPFPKYYPAILGMDAAGVIYQVGSGVKNFKVGDRVIGMPNWFWTNHPRDGAFQEYTICDSGVLSHLPDNIPFTAGCVLPLGLTTSTMGLYPSYRLGLPLPRASNVEPTNKVVLIWGGASSMGATAIQLCVASGVTVITTASAKNHTFVKSLGASEAFDYHDADVIQKLVSAIKATGKEFVGALDAVAMEEPCKACGEVAKELGGGKVVTNLPTASAHLVPEGVQLVPVNDNGDLLNLKGINGAVWGKFVPEGLKNGSLKPLPEPIVVGKGLEKIEEAVQILKKGVSAGKLVVEI